MSLAADTSLPPVRLEEMGAAGVVPVVERMPDEHEE